MSAGGRQGRPRGGRTGYRRCPAARPRRVRGRPGAVRRKFRAQAGGWPRALLLAPRHGWRPGSIPVDTGGQSAGRTLFREGREVASSSPGRIPASVTGGRSYGSPGCWRLPPGSDRQVQESRRREPLDAPAAPAADGIRPAAGAPLPRLLAPFFLSLKTRVGVVRGERAGLGLAADFRFGARHGEHRAPRCRSRCCGGVVRSLMRELDLEPCQPRPWRVSLTEGYAARPYA
jgi:hypothetical protein